MHSDQPENNTSIGQPPTALVKALSKVLRPLVRLLLNFQITYPFLVNLLKNTYVEVAEQEFKVPGKRQSDSRITLLTGVHRKDVKRIRESSEDEQVMPRTISAGAQLIGWWMGNRRYQDTDGKPLPLPIRAEQKDASPTFDELVEQVCKQDIRPRVILDEWLRLGVAHIDEQGCVRLNTGAFTPTSGFDEKSFFFGKNIHDHISAGAHNLRGDTPAMFDRSVYYDQLSPASVDELQALAETLGMEALINMNNRALQLQQRDAEANTGNPGKNADFRMNFGIFYYNNRYEKSVPDDDHA